MKKLIKRIWKKIVIYVRPFFNWKFLISFGIPWMLMNGWTYIGVALIPKIGLNWFTRAASVWLSILWLPGTPEKLITVPIAIWLHTKLFKNDKKTHDQLQIMYAEARSDWIKIKNKFKRKNKA